MKHAIQLMFGLAWVVGISSALAADRVAVIPLGSSRAQGDDQQVQYNDNGRLAGSTMYYDKANQRFGVGTSAPSLPFDVKDARAGYLAGVHNTSTDSQAHGLLVRADGGDPFGVQLDGGSYAFGIDRYGNSYTFGTSIITGDLAVGTFPSFKLTVNGTAGKPGGGSWSVLSDQRLKKNVAPLEDALAKITRLRGVSYEWVNPEEHGMGPGVQSGFLAQEVENIFPGWVAEVEPAGKDKNLLGENEKAKSLFLPMEFNAYLVEAIKELKAENQALKELVCADHPEAALCQSSPQ